MDCPKCGAYNETEVGSCLSCGASLAAEDAVAPTVMKPASRPPAQRLQQSGGPPKQCPNCMTLNAATFKFCARCGTPLGATGAPASTPPGAKPAGAAARPAAAGKPAPSSKAPPPPPAKPAAAARPAPPPPPKPMAGQVRPPAPPAKPAAPARPRARVSAIARDGSRSADFVLTKDETRVGREVET